MTTLSSKLRAMPPKNKKVKFFSAIIIDTLLKSFFLFFFFFFTESLMSPFFILLLLIFLILVTVLTRGLLKNHRWAYELLIGYGVLTIVLCIPISFLFFSLSFSQPIGSSEFSPFAFITGLAFLLACIPTVIMIILAREYKAQAVSSEKINKT